ncbi:MAG: hypothetical protein L3J71_04645 [Victivallaceae bacterium]|nr:hypothetical protein [Victivallaceae bacterium]
MKKKMLILSMCLAVGASIVVKAETNLFPIGEFKWLAKDCKVSTENQNGRYKCAMFLKLPAQEKRNFFFYYQDRNSISGKCSISLNQKIKLRAADLSMKFNFNQVNTKELHRVYFFVNPKIILKKDKKYEATMYIKGENPGQKLAISIMGNYKKAGSDKQRMNYKFYTFDTSTMWQPFTAQLNLNSRKSAQTGDITSIVIDVKTAGTFYVGKIVLVEKPLEK